MANSFDPRDRDPRFRAIDRETEDRVDNILDNVSQRETTRLDRIVAQLREINREVVESGRYDLGIRIVQPDDFGVNSLADQLLLVERSTWLPRAADLDGLDPLWFLPESTLGQLADFGFDLVTSDLRVSTTHDEGYDADGRVLGEQLVTVETVWRWTAGYDEAVREIRSLVRAVGHVEDGPVSARDVLYFWLLEAAEAYATQGELADEFGLARSTAVSDGKRAVESSLDEFGGEEDG